ncbi:MAG: sensor histidine kinase, partial [Candidatus Thorarchaeota archaeon]
IFGGFIILLAFNYTPIKKIPIRTLHSRLLAIAILIWVPIGLGFIPPLFSAAISSPFLFLSFMIIVRLLARARTKTLIDYWTLLSFMLWGIVSLPMMLLPILPEVQVFGYLQFIAQTIVSLFMFVAFVRNTRVQLEAQLQVSQLLRNILAHDLRNYLNVISSAIELTEAKDEESEKYLTIALESIASASTFMMEIRDTLLELSAAPLQLVDIDLKTLVSNVVDRVKSEHLITDDQIDFDSIPDNSIVNCSPLLREVIWNLLDNSIKHSVGPPMIELSVTTDNYLALVISDRAGGIPDDLREALLFKTGGRNGLGLGLTIVRDLLQICGVELDIDDVNGDDEVIGTSFHLKFNT